MRAGRARPLRIVEMAESKIALPSVTGVGAWPKYVERCAAGDQSALAALYDASNRLVYSMALRILQDTADAEEVTLDVYMQVWKTAQGYSGNRGSVGTWLVMLARTRAIDRLRSRQSRTRLEDPLPEQPDFAADILNPEQEAQGARQRQRVLSALQTLTPEQREAIELAVFSGFTHTELAVRLKQPLGTVKTRVRQGMMKLRVTLEELA
jgi:RNA polymerase sigma-70 factor (ECF subfamily)